VQKKILVRRCANLVFFDHFIIGLYDPFETLCVILYLKWIGIIVKALKLKRD